MIFNASDVRKIFAYKSTYPKAIIEFWKLDYC